MSTPAYSAAAPPNSKAVLIGRILSILVILFLIFDAVIHIMRPAPVVTGFAQLGFPLSVAVPFGVIELVMIILYAIPKTSVLGAILITGYLGGAIAAQVRIGAPLFSTMLFPIYVALFLWGGLYLREPRLRALVPLRS